MSNEEPQCHVAAHEVLAEEVGKLILRINTVEADLEHRIVVLESRMENVLARLDGHDLGFATLLLDASGRAMLADMLRRQDYGGKREEEGYHGRSGQPNPDGDHFQAGDAQAYRDEHGEPDSDRTIVTHEEGTSRS